jgi:hypothetical protein
MRIEKAELNNNLFPIEDLFYNLLNLIENNIFGFTQELNVAISEYKEIYDMKKITLENEDDITTILRRFLCDLDSPFDFEFQTKAPEKNEKTDIGVLRKYSKPRHIPFCIIEAKRLPTPVYSGSHETEYVCYKNSTKQGGIERFKTEKHGKNLPFSIMIAYIQKETPNHWHTKLNEWIAEEIVQSSNQNINWFEEDLLIENSNFPQPKITKYNSIHSRINLPKIKLTHYWLNLN